MVTIIYFTDIQTHASNYCLLNIKKYDDPRKQTKKLIFVDPGVMELRKHDEFKHIEKLHWLADGHLQSNEYLSIDYPCDMISLDLPREEYDNKCHQFREKSIVNNWKYAENPQYICTIQSYWMVQQDFEYRMKELEPIYAGKKKIVGLGNLCRLLIDRKKMKKTSAEYKYFKKVIEYIIRNRQKFYWIHIYGMSQYAIKQFVPLLQIYAPNIQLSVDATKFTRCPNKKMHSKYVKPKSQSQLFPTKYKQTGISCTKANRDEFFLENIKEIQKAGVTVQW